MNNRTLLVQRCGQLLTVTLLCFLLLTFACARPARGASVQPPGSSIVLGFKQYYGDPPKQHLGIDVAYKPGANLYAPVKGTISFIGRVPGSAGLNVTAVTIQQADGSLVTLNPFAATAVAKGASVSKGQLLGTLSATGDPSSPDSHAHLSLRVEGIYRDPSALIAPALDASQLLPAAPVVPTPMRPVAPQLQAAPAPAPAPVPQAQAALAPAPAPAPAPQVQAGQSLAPAGAALSGQASPSPVQAPAFAADLTAPAHMPAASPGLSAGNAPAGVLASAHAPAPARRAAPATAATAVTLVRRIQGFLARQNPVLRFGLLFCAGLALSAAGRGVWRVGRKIPAFLRSARELAGRGLQSAARGVTMVNRTFLLRTKPSSFGAVRPKEVI